MKLHSKNIAKDWYTDRSKKILELRSNGLEIHEVSDKVLISSFRVRKLIQEMVRLNKCRNETQLIAMALRNGVIE